MSESPVGGKPTPEGPASHRIASLGGRRVISDFKRRQASTQAASRKVEGIEPRNVTNRGRRRFSQDGSQQGCNRKGEDADSPPGSETVACAT